MVANPHQQGYRFHCSVLLLQMASFIISLSVGITLVIRANVAASAGNLHHDLDGTKSAKVVHRLHWMLLSVGITCLVVSALIFFNILEVIVLMLGPDSLIVRSITGLQPLRNRLEDEIVMIRAKQGLNSSENSYRKGLLNRMHFVR